MDGVRQARDDGGPLAALAARLAPPAGGPEARRLAQAVLASARALHGLAEELRPSGAEFRAAIDFLTEVGHSADDRRQEWVLLADVLGLSALIEDQGAPCPAGATPRTPAGPFYRPDAPEVANGADLSRDGRGEPMAVSGRIRALDGAAVAGAWVEIWQANAEGLYENQDPDRQPEFNLRGRLRADAGGAFAVRTVRPGPTRLPDDGPVGRLMAALGLGLDRPAHLNFRVTAPGFAPLVTQVFDRDDPRVGRDPIHGVKPALLAPFRDAGPGPRPGGAPRHSLDVTLTLARLAADGASDPA